MKEMIKNRDWIIYSKYELNEIFGRLYYIGDVYINCPYDNIVFPDNLSIIGNLTILKNNNIKFGKNMIITGNLEIDNYSTIIGNIPKDIIIGGNVKLLGNYSIPNNIKIGGNLIIQQNYLTNFFENLKNVVIGKNINIDNDLPIKNIILPLRKVEVFKIKVIRVSHTILNLKFT